MADLFDNSAAIGNALGRGVGSFLGDRLDELAQHRTAQLHQRQKQAQQHQTSSLLQNLGFAPEEAAFVSTLPDKYQADFVSAYLSNLPAQSQQSSQESSPLQVPQDNVAQRLSTLGVQSPSERQEAQNVSKILSDPVMAQLFKQSADKVPLTVEPPLAKNKNQPVSEAPKPTVKRPTLADALSQRQDLNKQQSKQQLDEEKRIQKETLPYYNEVLKADRSAYDSEKRLKRMTTLIEKGSLPISTFYKLFKNLEEHVSPTTGAAVGAGIGGLAGSAATLPAGGVGGIAISPIGAAVGGAIGGLVQPVASLLRSAQQFTSPDTDEFEKLSNDFVRDAKGIFGSRITDADLKVFLSMVPTLAQTDNGKKAIIRNMDNFLKGVHVKAEVMKDIVKENNGKRPANLEILVEERARPQLEKLSNDFELGLDKAIKVAEKTPAKKQLYPQANTNKKTALPGLAISTLARSNE